LSALPDSLAGALRAADPWEALAVALAVAYLVLAIRENIWCWVAGMASSAIYLVLLAEAALYQESALQVFYIGVSLYGWYRWGGPPSHTRIHRWRARDHAAALAAVGVLTLGSGALLARHTDAALPFLDALITWGSILATWMVARKVIENWWYWLVIDGLSVFVYLQRGLWLTAALFAGYLVLIVIGLRTWRRHMAAQPA
jgi:nicotinamide mononucleotide transporter